ncbi:tRNA-guanosine(34) transglycosylase [Candidatus Babeliales bacterium]|nr:tRNA-guanosine(34) transglycosylase [Candidatus Babeliales bacterium]
MLKFEVIHQSKKSRARVGRIHTAHGIIETPSFVAVGTNGVIKALDSTMIEKLEVQLMFCNTYHLMVQPGADTVESFGGLHSFMNRKGPIITDSGGFQVFSLKYGGVARELKSKGTKVGSGCVLKINEEGVLFRSYRDGSPLLLTPETSIAAQKQLGADIIVSFDELPPYHMDPRALRKSLDRTHRWEERSIQAHQANPKNQSIYAVVHGGIDKKMRQESVEFLSKLPFDGYAIGGSVGKNREEMMDMLAFVMPKLPENKPNHLLGIADLPSIERIVPLGVDTFDSAHPTKCARHGLLFTFQGMKKIKQAIFARDSSPIDPTCDCLTCLNYSSGYVHHLFKARELTALSLATIHNIAHMTRLMKQMREAILNDEI